jgi:transposase/FtsZ-binding cell division protein ZapB
MGHVAGDGRSPLRPDELRAFAQALQAQHAATAAELAGTVAELRAAKATIQLTALEIEKLKVQLARLRRMQFGQSSERLTREIEQLELRLEELETVEAEATSASVDAGVPPPAREKRRPKRLPLPDHLPRQEVVHAAPHADGCGACGGTMSALGEDVTEVLEYVPGRFQVVRHVRPKLACQRCDAITQAPAPALPIPRGKAGPGLLAHVLVSKYADHLPLYRQAEIYAREGVDLDRSTMADWVGQVSWLLQPLVDHIRAHVFAADKIHTDDTPVPVLAPGSGKTKTGRLWSMPAMTGAGRASVHRQQPTSTRLTARVTDRARTSLASAGSCRRTAMRVTTSCTMDGDSPAPSSRSRAGRMSGARSTTFGRRQARPRHAPA